MNLYPLPLARNLTRGEVEPIYAVLNHRRVLYVGQTSQSIGKRLAQHCNHKRPSELGGHIWAHGDEVAEWWVLTMRVEEIEVDWSLIRWNFHQAPLDVKLAVYFDKMRIEAGDYRYQQAIDHLHRKDSTIARGIRGYFSRWERVAPLGWEQTWIRRLDAKPPVDRAECFLIMLHNPPLNSTYNYSPKRPGKKASNEYGH